MISEPPWCYVLFNPHSHCRYISSHTAYESLFSFSNVYLRVHPIEARVLYPIDRVTRLRRSPKKGSLCSNPSKRESHPAMKYSYKTQAKRE